RTPAVKTLVGRIIAISRTPPWLPSRWGCRDRREKPASLMVTADQARRSLGYPHPAAPTENRPRPDRSRNRPRSVPSGYPVGSPPSPASYRQSERDTNSERFPPSQSKYTSSLSTR